MAGVASAGGVHDKTIPFGTYSAQGSAAFFNSPTEVSDTQSPIVADFGDTILGANTSFTDTFTFGSVYNGVGSGSVSTSTSDSTDVLTIDSVSINGVSYPVSSAEKGISGVSIKAGPDNTLVISGVTGPNALFGTFAGTATISRVSATPEPAAWMLMIGGIGFAGAALRRRQSALQVA
jgi:hypothetical protein